MGTVVMVGDAGSSGVVQADADEILKVVAPYQMGTFFPGSSSSIAMEETGLYGPNGTFTDNASTILGSTDGLYFSQDTSAVADNDAFTVPGTTGPSHQLQSRPYVVFKVMMAETTLKRFFCGLSSSATSATVLGTDAPNTAHIGLSYSTDRSDTNWQITRDSAAGSPTTADTGVAVSTNVVHLVLDGTTASQVTVRLLDNTFTQLFTATYTTDLPPGTNSLHPFVGTRTRTTAVKTHRIYGVVGVNMGQIA